MIRRMLKNNAAQWQGSDESPVRQLLRDAVRDTGGSFKDNDSRGPSIERRNREALRKGEHGSLAALQKAKTGSIDRILSMEKNNLLIAPSQPLQPHMVENSKKEIRAFY